VKKTTIPETIHSHRNAILITAMTELDLNAKFMCMYGRFLFTMDILVTKSCLIFTSSDVKEIPLYNFRI